MAKNSILVVGSSKTDMIIPTARPTPAGRDDSRGQFTTRSRRPRARTQGGRPPPAPGAGHGSFGAAWGARPLGDQRWRDSGKMASPGARVARSGVAALGRGLDLCRARWAKHIGRRLGRNGQLSARPRAQAKRRLPAPACASAARDSAATVQAARRRAALRRPRRAR